MRSNHSTRAKVPGKARAAQRDSGPQQERVQAKAKTKSATHPTLIAKAQAPGKVKAEKDPEMRQEPEKVETNLAERQRDKLKTSAVIWLNIIVRAQPGEISKDVEIRWEQKITRTETLAETKRKRAPAKWQGPEVVLLTDLVR
jgi:hypothetical protein